MSPNPIDCCTYKSGSWRSPRATVSPLDHPPPSVSQEPFQHCSHIFPRHHPEGKVENHIYSRCVADTKGVCVSLCMCVCACARYSFSLYLIKSGSQGLANIVFAGMLIPASHALGSNQGCAVRNRPLWTRSEEIKRQSILVIGK